MGFYEQKISSKGRSALAGRLERGRAEIRASCTDQQSASGP